MPGINRVFLETPLFTWIDRIYCEEDLLSQRFTAPLTYLCVRDFTFSRDSFLRTFDPTHFTSIDTHLTYLTSYLYMIYQDTFGCHQLLTKLHKIYLDTLVSLALNLGY